MVQGYVIKVMKIIALGALTGMGYIFDIINEIAYNI